MAEIVYLYTVKSPTSALENLTKGTFYSLCQQQSSWLVTTMKTSTCLTPTTVTGQTIAGDTRDTATMLQVLNCCDLCLYRYIGDWFWEVLCGWQTTIHFFSSPLAHSEGCELLRAVQRVRGQRERLWTHLPVGQALCSHRTVHGGRQRRSGESGGKRRNVCLVIVHARSIP